MISIEQKIQHFNLDLYYSKNVGLERETNNIITKELNNFLLSYGDKFKSHTFVLDYMDDGLSLVYYYFLASIAGVSNFKFSIYSKAKETKKFLPKEAKFIRMKEIKKLQKQNKLIIISVLNPIEQVANKKFEYSDFISPLSKLLPNQLEQLARFYNLPLMPFEDDRAALRDFIAWSRMETKKVYNNFSSCYNEDRIYLVKLNDDLAANQKILQEAQDQDCMIYYSWDGNNPDIVRQLKEFSYYVKRNSNIFGYANVERDGYNAAAIAKELGVKLVVNGEEIE